MDEAVCNGRVGFSSYGEPGQGQYSRDNCSSHCTAKVAAAYVTKVIGE